MYHFYDIYQKKTGGHIKKTICPPWGVDDVFVCFQEINF